MEEEKTKYQKHYEKYKQTILEYQEKNREKYKEYSRNFQQRKMEKIRAQREKDIVDAYLLKNSLQLKCVE